MAIRLLDLCYPHSAVRTTSHGTCFRIAADRAIIVFPPAAVSSAALYGRGVFTTLAVYETIELVATTPNGHAYIDGAFAWEPVAIQVREG